MTALPPSPETILQQVARRIVPNNQERKNMLRLSDRLAHDVEQALSESRIDGMVSLQGSFARDTWVSGETDLDIFIRFDPSIERKQWIEKVLPSIRQKLSRYHVTERYAEHPFLEFYVDSIRVNVVPCYRVPKGEWKSATDRTPYHTEFMKNNLTDELRLQARLLKKFAKGIGVYGAEIKIGGFSGMLVDTLTLYYRSFLETIKHASSWTEGTLLEIGKPQRILESKKREAGVDLVTIDPVDPDRNLAAAVRPDRLWSFVAAGRQFQQNPGMWYFFPPAFARKSKGTFGKKLDRRGRAIVAIVLKHPFLVSDVLWGQLMRFERSLLEMLVREDFRIFRSKIWSDDKAESAILLEAEQVVLSDLRPQRGPPLWKTDDSISFLKRHLGSRDTARGPWIEGNRWQVEKKRRVVSIMGLVNVAVRDVSYGLAIPRQISESFPRGVRVLEGQAVLSLLGRDGFDKALWEFLEARPQWLKSARS